MTDTTIHPSAVVMGVAGSGKTAVGTRLAARLGVDFIDADDLHPAANVARMRAGRPLDDDSRRPWLAAVGAWLSRRRRSGAVTACSALKRSYRDQLRGACPGVVFIHLAGDRDLIAKRVARRAGHFMPASLVDSQFETLEGLQPDEDGITLDVGAPIEGLVRAAEEWLSARS